MVRRLRSALSITLIVVACILGPLALVAAWVANEVGDTDTYVATMAPLAEDPAVRNAVTNRITTEVMAQVDVPALVGDLSAALSDRGVPSKLTSALDGLAAPIDSGVESFVRTQVGTVVSSPAFATVWSDANRAIHASVVFVLGLTVAIGAYALGPARPAVAARTALVSGIARLRRGAARVGFRDGGLGRWAARYLTAARIVCVLAAAVTLVVVDRPTAGTVLLIAACLLAALALVQFLAADGRPASSE